jgi:hypothetical protein
MLIELLTILTVELIILAGILIIYWTDYTYSFIHCHEPLIPYRKCRRKPKTDGYTWSLKKGGKKL